MRGARSPLRSILKRLARTWMASLALGLLALTACASKELPPPRVIALEPEIPAVLTEGCTESPRPSPQASLDAADPSPAAVLAAYLARGVWIAALYDFTAALEGDRLCERNRGDAGLIALELQRQAAAELRGRAR